jgi:hypothetical protein
MAETEKGARLNAAPSSSFMASLTEGRSHNDSDHQTVGKSTVVCRLIDGIKSHKADRATNQRSTAGQ